jgi:hypothetical protein
VNWCDEIELHGYSIIPEVSLGAETAGLLECFQRTNLRRSRAGIRHALKDASIAVFAQNAELLAFAKTILGEAAFSFEPRYSTSPRTQIGSSSGTKTPRYP